VAETRAVITCITNEPQLEHHANFVIGCPYDSKAVSAVLYRLCLLFSAVRRLGLAMRNHTQSGKGPSCPRSSILESAQQSQYGTSSAAFTLLRAYGKTAPGIIIYSNHAVPFLAVLIDGCSRPYSVLLNAFLGRLCESEQNAGLPESFDEIQLRSWVQV
jgi:hypothetical protein